MSSFEGVRPATTPPEIHPYVRVVNWLREQIVSGRIPLGSKLPAEETLKRDFGVDRSVIRRAVAMLREEGLVVTRHGIGSFVAAVPTREVVILYPGDQVSACMPDAAQRDQAGSPSAGIPVLAVIRSAGGDPELYNAAITVLHVHE